jgi:hypothetical protein
MIFDNDLSVNIYEIFGGWLYPHCVVTGYHCPHRFVTDFTFSILAKRTGIDL